MANFLIYDIHMERFIRLQQMLHKVTTVILGIKWSSAPRQLELLDHRVHCDEKLVSEACTNYCKIERDKCGQLFFFITFFSFQNRNKT
jgi:hypothetical protein